MRASRCVFLVGALLLLTLTASGRAADRPPVETGAFRSPDLVEVNRVAPAIRLDIRYATPNNFMKTVLYPSARCYLQRPVAQALARVDRSLRRRGFGLLVFDGYRPWSVTKRMWDQARPEWRSGGYVGDPARGSRHNRGATVDLTLFSLASGQPVEMTSGYDDFTSRAHADCRGGTPAARHHRRILFEAMGREGFQVLPEEWWHFNHHDWRVYRIMDVPFGDLERAGRRQPTPAAAPATH